jgi:hypothetical protein
MEKLHPKLEKFNCDLSKNVIQWANNILLDGNTGTNPRVSVNNNPDGVYIFWKVGEYIFDCEIDDEGIFISVYERGNTDKIFEALHLPEKMLKNYEGEKND